MMSLVLAEPFRFLENIQVQVPGKVSESDGETRGNGKGSNAYVVKETVNFTVHGKFPFGRKLWTLSVSTI